MYLKLPEIKYALTLSQLSLPMQPTKSIRYFVYQGNRNIKLMMSGPNLFEVQLPDLFYRAHEQQRVGRGVEGV